MAVYTVTRRLYHTADRARVVEEGDPAAAFLYAGVGAEIPLADAERYGLLAAPPAPEPAAATQAVPVAAGEDKGTDAPRGKARR